MRFETLAVHSGAEPDPETGALVPPIHLATTFEHGPDGSLPHGLLYQRYDNPTQQRLEQALRTLEQGAQSLFFATGMAAGATLLQALPNGAHILMPDDIYHGYRALVEQYGPRWGLSFSFVDLTDLGTAAAALRPASALLWVESPSNPLLKIYDIKALAELAHTADAQLMVDNTFATPCLQQPLAMGANIVLHSTTKYIGGHSDVMGGTLIFRDDNPLADEAWNLRKLAGASASPFAAWLCLRGLRSLPARMAWHGRNAQAIAEALASHPGVLRVHYPGLPTHPQHALAKRQMRGFGGMISFELRGGREAALMVAGRLKLFVNATSLGGCESLVEHRASVEGTQPVSPPGLLRLSVGLEHPEDLLSDLLQALDY